MHPTSYVTYAQVKAQSSRHLKQYGSKTSFKNIVTYLFNHNLEHIGTPALPSDVLWSTINDATFFDLLDNLPVRNLFENFSNSSHSIAAESIMPEALEVFAIRYVPDIIEHMHTHNFFEVNYVMSGHCKMTFENETRVLSTGELYIIAPHSRHDVTVNDDSIVISLMLRKNTFDTTFFQLLAKEDLLSSFFRTILYSKKETTNYISFRTDNSNDIRNTIKDIFMESYISDAYSNTCIISRTHLLFSLLLRRYSNTIQIYDSQKSSNAHADFIQILLYIQNHYQNVTLENLASVFHYNMSYLSRMIKKNTNQTLVDILTNMRMTKARELLCHTNLKLEQISSIVGYNSTDHFSKLFKRIHKMTPSDYRKNHSC